MFYRIFLLATLLLFVTALHSQELYVFTEPASNLPARSVSAKLTARYSRNEATGSFAQRYNPELMAGLSRKLQVKLGTSFSDFYTPGLRWESLKGGVKWRFLSNDGIHRHFRMAAFADAAYSRNDMVYDEMNLDGDNSGLQAGVIATQLLGRLALSGTASYMRVWDEKFQQQAHAGLHDQNSINASVSAGFLVFPFQNDDYNKVNGNIYVEALGAKGLEKGLYYFDLAPAFQLIFSSRTKLNLGARFQAAGNMQRLARNSWFIGVETSFLQAWKQRKKE